MNKILLIDPSSIGSTTAKILTSKLESRIVTIVRNTCPHCSIELEFEELGREQCGYCNKSFNPHLFNNLEINCYECRNIIVIRTIIETWIDKFHILMCEKCGS